MNSPNDKKLPTGQELSDLVSQWSAERATSDYKLVTTYASLYPSLPTSTPGATGPWGQLSVSRGTTSLEQAPSGPKK